MARGLLVIDIQRDYFPGGAFPLVDPEAAAAAARTVLDVFRAAGDPVVHLRHVWDGPEATFMRPGTPGVEIHPAVAPVDSEPVLDKTEPNGFLGTGLAEVLEETGRADLHVVGMMSSMCVDATVRAAADLRAEGHRGPRRLRRPRPGVRRASPYLARWSTPPSWPPWRTAMPTW